MIINYYEYITENINNQFFQNKQEIIDWLNDMDIDDYIINDDLTVDVKNSVYLDYKDIKYLPIQFNIIHGAFNCANTRIKTLKGFPKEIYGKLSINNTRIKTLKYCPQIITGDFFCQDNILNSINDLNPKLYIQNYNKGWIHELKTEIIDKYFLKYYKKNPELIKYLEKYVSNKIKQDYKYLFDANKFDLI